MKRSKPRATATGRAIARDRAGDLVGAEPDLRRAMAANPDAAAVTELDLATGAGAAARERA
ncbi:MAG: hypothetical protein ACOY3L_08545 [Pseudomonadota bacterium]